MAAAANTAAVGGNGSRKARGRQDPAGQEKVIEEAKLHDRIPHLVRLLKTSEEASTAFSEAVKAVAEKSGLLASVVRTFVKAKAGENYDEKKKEVEQLHLVFEHEG